MIQMNDTHIDNFFNRKKMSRSSSTSFHTSSSRPSSRSSSSSRPSSAESFYSTKSNAVVCSVCLENVNEDENDETVIKTRCCKKLFHRICLAMWLSKSDTCPLCRKAILPPMAPPILTLRNFRAWLLGYGTATMLRIIYEYMEGMYD